jgi:hypothetical protein
MTTQEAQRACMERLTKRMEGSPTDECATCQHFETYAAQGTDYAPMIAGACLVGDRARPCHARNDACELYSEESVR